jgi:DNA excision repair protein ERCC-3
MEDGLENDGFSLIGPKKYDMHGRILEKCNWIVRPLCTEVARGAFPTRYACSTASPRTGRSSASLSENVRKIGVVKKILDRHEGANISIIGSIYPSWTNSPDSSNCLSSPARTNRI